MFAQYNPNPKFLDTGDCVVRAVSKLFDTDWDTAFTNLAAQAYSMKRMPSDNITWGEYLRKNGYKKELLRDCPDCMTIREFCDRFTSGKYALATGSHVVAAVNGVYFDSYDSGDDIILYVWRYNK